MCYTTDEEHGGFAAEPGSNYSWWYQSGAELEENGYSTILQSYSGGGYVLRNASRLLKRTPHMHSFGTEFYKHAHSRLDLSDLKASGWFSPATSVYFHDFTLFSAGAVSYKLMCLVLSCSHLPAESVTDCSLRTPT